MTIALTTYVFVQLQRFGDVPQVLNPSILILLVQLRIGSLRILSIGIHPVLFLPNLSVMMLEVAISEEAPGSL